MGREMYYNHILAVILFTPLVGALAILLTPSKNREAIKWMANVFAMLGFAVSLPLVPWFWNVKDRAGFKFIEGSPNNWIP
jgi:NADH:ubiquinone oxidoreductase subunit 4 (subunit M)